MSLELRSLRTDVLILGGGLAALRAAVAAREAGAAVTMVVKGKAGQSGCSAITTAGYAAPIHSGDSVGRHAHDTEHGGTSVADPTLVRMLCEGAVAQLEWIERLGVGFKGGAAERALSPSGDHSIPRVLTTLNDMGTDLTIPVRERALSLGVQVIENTMAVELATSGDGVCGTVCLDLRGGAVLAIASSATVLATGGLGRLFDLTSNPRDVTGDGYALGARAGAELRDMEFIQFYPWRCVDPFPNARVSIQPSTWVHGGRLFNAAGERFMLGFNPAGAEATTRDVAARGIYVQMRQGLGVSAGVRADLSLLSPDVFARSNPKLARLLARMGIDHRTYPFIVTPEAHYMMGGLHIDRDCACSVPRLFAAGEAAGGIHGANRINSNAMPEAMVFGARAGSAASGMTSCPGNFHAVEDAARTWSALPEADVAVDGLEARTRTLRRNAWSWLGIVRNAAAMRTGLTEVRSLRASLATRPRALPSMRAWLELQNLCETAELCLIGALARRESRGAHFREDMPMRDDAAWRRSVFVRREADGDLVSSLQEAA